MKTRKKTYSARAFVILLAACLLSAALPEKAFAAVDYEVYQTENGGFLRVDRYTRTLDAVTQIEGDLVIPSIVGETPIEAIADGLFYNNEDLTSVTIPSSVKKVGDRTFMNCTNLTTATFGEGLVSLGKDAFRHCYALRNVTLPSTLTAIQDNTFLSCIELQSITVPAGVKSIGSKAFADCSKLGSITLPDGITSIGDYAFQKCASLGAIQLPSQLQSISTGLFNGCSALSSVTLSGNVKTIGQKSFGGCASLVEMILPEGVQTLEKLAFSECSRLSALSVPGSVSSIAIDAFDGCDALTLYVKAGTLAQVFASANSIPFKLGTLGGGDTPAPPPVVYPDTPFSDVQSHWAKEEIKWAYANKYFKGVGNNRFAPEDPVTRGMLATVLYRMEGEPSAGTAAFSDVPSSAYYARAVAWAQSAGIVRGVGNNRFAPTRSITRQELATMLYRYAEYKRMNVSARGDLSGYTDVSQISASAGTAMAWAVGVKIIGGVTKATLVPTGSATRAQTVVMLKRFADLR